MPLQETSLYASDVAGANETIQLQSTSAIIQNAYYGTDSSGNPKPATVAADGKSLTITILKGLNALTVALISPSLAPELVSLYQGDPKTGALATPTVSTGTGSSAIFILGA